MAEQDGTLVTCGGTTNSNHLFMPDVFLKVFDLRRLEQSMPVSFAPGAVQARFHPIVRNSLAILANSGAFQTCEYSSGRVYNTRFHYYRTQPTDGAIGLDVSSTGDCLVIADSSSLLQLWQSKARPPKVNVFSMPVEVPPIRTEPLYPKLIDNLDDPRQTEPACPQGGPSLGEGVDGSPLLSTWPSEEKLLKKIRPAIPIHQDVLSNLQMNDFVGVSQNVCGWKLNAAVSVVMKEAQLKEEERLKERKSAGAPSLQTSCSVASMSLDASAPASLSLPRTDSAALGGVDCDSPSDAVRGVEQLMNDIAADDDDDGG
eukprot:gnl/TRDRNA2_/TRDRNA2_129711_c2_seq1.p1 gnl/TRDRNA2_/TRDRNA2_129711_c2~~gnl/TRDRNA2_/TRDRNA2_129711_c2_seq1.p1  ORF type:complete len:333 (-),score=58.33 gnl/TRDRNA2_/TRDRNA2_129711_c2_seq1:31-975(-)